MPIDNLIRKTSGDRMRKCFYCDNDILEKEGKIFPLDIPYVNIWVHKQICFDAMYDKQYLQDNYQKILDYAGTPTKIKRK